MGGHPINAVVVRPRPPQPGFDSDHVEFLERRLRGRRSWFGWRRRRAYSACQRLIVHRERVCDLVPPWEPPPCPAVPAKPADSKRTLQMVVGGAGCTVATPDRIDVKKTFQ